MLRFDEELQAFTCYTSSSSTGLETTSKKRKKFDKQCLRILLHGKDSPYNHGYRVTTFSDFGQLYFRKWSMDLQLRPHIEVSKTLTFYILIFIECQFPSI